MPTHHQKLHDLDQPATRRDVLRMMQQMARATDARLTAAGIPPLTEAPLEAHICEDES
jgi:hypothetical protein